MLANGRYVTDGTGYVALDVKAQTLLKPFKIRCLRKGVLSHLQKVFQYGYSLYPRQQRHRASHESRLRSNPLTRHNRMGSGQSSQNIRQYYERRFEPPNKILDIQNHTFVLLDGPGLVDEDYQRSARGVPYDAWYPLRDGPVEFVHKVDTSQEIVLLTHIPLYRPDQSSCGPLREKGTIRKGVGHGYQNTLGKHTTKFLLDTLEPKQIFRYKATS